SGGYWQAFALHAAVKMDVFSHVGNEGIAAEALAVKLGCDKRALTMLLNGLTAMGLLDKKTSFYYNTEAGKTLLVKASPRYVGHMIMHHHHLVQPWYHLAEAVKCGGPVEGARLPEEERRESFLMGMFNTAMATAPTIAKVIDLRGRKHLLDLGGGPGTYAIHFCRENPGLKATVFDLPTTEPFARKTIERFGFSDRIDFVPGNYIKDDIPGRYDVVWLSHILHGEGPAGCRTIIHKAAGVLEPGGLCLIHDFILNNNLDGPFFPALFSLNMLVNTKEGRSYSEAEIMEMMGKAGLGNLRRLPFEGPTQSCIIAGEA
ncbi:MAG: methyltransferase domain-containing protein, partial [Deltaproteobacteria bacterium]|nr:methyltransferase domain-containing protein [Deltaproteobacteria bacterium]